MARWIMPPGSLKPLISRDRAGGFAVAVADKLIMPARIFGFEDDPDS